MSFWSGFLGGSNPTLNAGIKQAGQVAGYGTTKGEGLTTAAGDFFTGLLSGNPAQTAKLLAPQIKAQQDQAQQMKNTSAQFANRSGGTNARNQSIDDATRGKISSMISDLTGKAATASAAPSGMPSRGDNSPEGDSRPGRATLVNSSFYVS